MTWNEYFMAMAHLASSKSKDQSIKVGAVVVGPNNEIRSTGYNGIPRGVDDDKPYRHVRPEKYKWFEHAERNAIYNAAFAGVCTRDCKMFVTMCPCSDCGRAIIQAGITEVVVPTFDVPGRWLQDWLVTQDMFLEADVKIRSLECKL